MKEYECFQVATREDLPTKPPKAWQKQCKQGYKRALSEPGNHRPWVEFYSPAPYAVLRYETGKLYFS